MFKAQNYNGKYYIDGGVTRNLPAEEVRAMGAEFVIGSSIYGVDVVSIDRAAKMNRLEVAARSMNIFQRELSRTEEKSCDFCLKPPAQEFAWFDFFKMEEIAAVGRKSAAEQIKNLRPLLSKKRTNWMLLNSAIAKFSSIIKR